MDEGLKGLIIVIIAWGIALYSIHMVSPLLTLLFFIVTFPLICIISALLGRMDGKTNNNAALPSETAEERH